MKRRENQRKINKAVRFGKHGGNTVDSQPTKTLPKRGLQKNKSH